MTAARDATPIPVMMSWAPRGTWVLNRPGLHIVASAAPTNRPMLCESVPKYARLGSASTG